MRFPGVIVAALALVLGAPACGDDDSAARHPNLADFCDQYSLVLETSRAAQNQPILNQTPPGVEAQLTRVRDAFRLLAEVAPDDVYDDAKAASDTYDEYWEIIKDAGWNVNEVPKDDLDRLVSELDGELRLIATYNGNNCQGGGVG